jgi:hypothetical protein
VIDEPDVALTDWGLAVEAAAFAVLLARERPPARCGRAWWVLFFAAGSVAALVGGTVHAFWGPRTTPVADALWIVTLLVVGLASLAAWGIGARLQFSRVVARWIVTLAVAGFAAYTVAILAGVRAFALAAGTTLVSALFLLAVFARAAVRTNSRPAWTGFLGVLTTIVAAYVQWARIGVHPAFGHNALYHVIQAVALLMLFTAARGLGRTAEEDRAC